MKSCSIERCNSKTHPICDQCQKEIRNRHDCQSGTDFRCNQCPNVICQECCKKIPKIDWEQFHNQYIKKFKPKCISCGDKCYPGEGFVVKVKGEIGGRCSQICWEESGLINDWNIWEMHPPKVLLE